MAVSKIPGVLAFDMDARAEDMPDFPVVTFDNSPYPDEIMTYTYLVSKGRKLARALKKNGIGRGDAFALVMRNHPEMVLAFYAASAVGAIVVPIDPRSRGRKLRFQIANSGSKGVIFAAEFMEFMDEVLPSLQEVKTIGVVYKNDFGLPISNTYPDLREILEGPEAPPGDMRKNAIEDYFMIIYTSGTTGEPKGVKTRNRFQRSGEFGQGIWGYTKQDKLYTGLSLTHGNAQAVTLGPALQLAIPAVISRRFTKSRIWDICRAHGCTTFSLLGGMMMGIYSEPVRDDDGDNPVRLVISAGSPRPIWEAFEKRFKVQIHEWYAAVEGGFAHKPPGVGPIGSFGKPPAGSEIRVVRENDTDCVPGEMGELISRPATGKAELIYHGNEEASESKTRGGWLRSGDMVHRDEDGWLYFDYRKGGGLRRQGDFIMPEHLEAVIAEHPDVTDVCVYGIPASSGAPGESDLVAAIVPVMDVTPDIEGIFDKCRQGLEKNSVPSYVEILPEIPKTASLKNLDRVLKDAFNPDGPNVYKYEDQFK